MILLDGLRNYVRSILYICLFFVLIPQINAQDQRIADSLNIIYDTGKYKPEDKLEILKNLAKYHTDPEKKLEFSETLINESGSTDSFKYLFNGYLFKGTALRLKGNVTEALNSFLKASDIASSNNYQDELGEVTIAIADAYSVIENHRLATTYYNKGLSLIDKEENSQSYAIALFNLGDEYFKLGVLDSALYFYQQSGDIFRELDYQIGLAYILGNIGQVHTELQNYEIAETNLTNAIRILTELGDLYPVCVYLLDLSTIYTDRKDYNNALDYARQSLEYAKQFELKEVISDANLMISELYEKIGRPDQSFNYYKDYITYRDSINNLAAVQEMAELRTEYEVAQKQAEVDLLTKEAEIADLQDKRQKWVIFGTGLSLFLVGVLAISAFRRYKFVQATNQLIQSEKNRSEELLLNILPQETASELREKGSVKARKIEGVSVLFTDFIDFTRLAEHAAPEHIIKSLDYYFKKFDEITTKYNLEKIKTIGDSYMCAGGLHTGATQAKDVIRAACEMIQVVEEIKQSENDFTHYDIRIGVHTGPVVAGIVGTKKWQFDIWGDTVNIASGMETTSVAGKINISEQTYNKISDEFSAEYRGEKRIKNRGLVKMYFIT